MTKQRPDYSRAAGGAALGARLRRLSERLDRDATRIYARQGIRFEQRWFGVLNQLVIHGSMSIGELAQALNITHVSVSQTSRSLATAGIVSSVTAPADARRRSLRLTAKGAALVARLAPLWSAFDAAAVLAAPALAARPQIVPPDASFMATLPGLLEVSSVPGISIGVVQRGRVVWQAQAGVTDLKMKTPVSAQTIWKAASLSKQVT